MAVFRARLRGIHVFEVETSSLDPHGSFGFFIFALILDSRTDFEMHHYLVLLLVRVSISASTGFSPSENGPAQAVITALRGIGQSQIPISLESAVSTTASAYWLDEQDHTGNARGYAPFLGNDFTYPVYRNVRSFGATGNGQTDDTDALQNAINTDGKGGSRYRNEVTTRPAEVYVPGGVYRISRTIDLRLNTILVGNPNDRPVFKATPDFGGESLINGYDFATDGSAGTTNFLVAVKNIIIDTTNINKDKSVIALNWGVAQACQLTNIRIQMPSNSGGHVGIAIDQGSTILIGDIVCFLAYRLFKQY